MQAGDLRPPLPRGSAHAATTSPHITPLEGGTYALINRRIVTILVLFWVESSRERYLECPLLGQAADVTFFVGHFATAPAATCEEISRLL